MTAADSNILAHAHRGDSVWREPARSAVRSLAEGRVNRGLPWPCVHEFLAIVTHPRIYDPPSTITEAADQVEAWLESPVVELLTETGAHWEILRHHVETGRVSGPLVQDARIAALCLEHGVTEFWTADRDFSRFPDLATRNPLLRP